MPLRYAALYVSLGIILGLCLHLAVTLRAAEGGSAGPAFPIAKADTAYT